MKAASHLSPCLLLPLLGLAAAGCAPQIGDSCKTSGDCSLDGQRICDTAQPDGYCTIQGCDPDSCPDGAYCVEFRFDPPRTSETYCMRKCRSDGSCRDGYRCVTQDDPALRSYVDCSCLARIIDLDLDPDQAHRFCAATGAEEPPDAGPVCAFPPTDPVDCGL